MKQDTEILLEWEYPEYDEHERSKRWWVIFGIIVVVLLVLAILFQNYIGALILIMITTIIIYQNNSEPNMVSFGITQDGIIVNEREFPWKDIEYFWLVYEPPEVKQLYIAYKSKIRPVLSVPLQDQNPIDVRNTLKEYIDEDLEKENEPTTDALGRLLKL